MKDGNSGSKIKQTLKHLKDLHGNVRESEHLFKKGAELAKSEGLSEAAEFCRNSAKEQRTKGNEIEDLIRNLR